MEEEVRRLHVSYSYKSTNRVSHRRRRHHRRHHHHHHRLYSPAWALASSNV